MRLKFLLIPTLALSLSLGQELLVNGDFEQELSVGWTYTDSGSGTHLAQRGTEYQPDPDYEAYVYQYDNPGWTRLSQRVDVPGVALQLSFWARFNEGGGSSTCWPAACFQVCYYNDDNVLLGETRYYYSTYADWVPSPTLSLYRITNPDWSRYELNIPDELTQNLPGVNPGEVAKVEVALFSYTISG
ncbi:MAG: hypothetical protein ABIK44_00915 [candidate division WOR-3 bacterium]